MPFLHEQIGCFLNFQIPCLNKIFTLKLFEPKYQDPLLLSSPAPQGLCAGSEAALTLLEAVAAPGQWWLPDPLPEKDMWFSNMCSALPGRWSVLGNPDQQI